MKLGKMDSHAMLLRQHSHSLLAAMWQRSRGRAHFRTLSSSVGVLHIPLVILLLRALELGSMTASNIVSNHVVVCIVCGASLEPSSCASVP